MESLTHSMLIDFSEMEVTPQLKDYHNQVYSSIKLDIADLQKYQRVDSFVQCENEKCKMILTVEDKGQIFDFQEVESNIKAFDPKVVQKLSKNKFSTVLWICNFCSYNNVINIADLKFAKNKTRVVVKQRDKQSKDPILLIVFDISGSMEQQIKLKKDETKQKDSATLTQLQKTQIYKKIVEDQKQQQRLICQQVEKKNNQNLKDHNKYQDHLKKNKLLMGLTQILIGKIFSPSKNGLQKFCQGRKSNNEDFKKDCKNIGFVFFNSNVFISIPTNKENKVVHLFDSNYQSQNAPPKLKNCEKQKVDFDDFQSLYKVGQKYGHQFKTKVQDFSFQNLDLKSLSDYAQGQTALGPAIATALGITNQHGHGSSIVVVTDGFGNRGIFDQTETWEEASKVLKMKLEKNRCFLTILQLRKQEGDKKLETSLDKFCAKDPNHKSVRKINVVLQQEKSNIDDYYQKLKPGINRNDTNWANQVRIRSQHRLISYKNSQQELTKKLLNQSQPCYIKPNTFDFKNLKDKDYLHSFMTQVVIKYENTRNKQQSIFMTYIIQKFVKYSQMKEKDIKVLDSQKTFFNVMEYLNTQEQNYDLQNLPLGLIKRSFRDTISMRSMGMKTLRFPSMKSNQNMNKQGWIQNLSQYQNEYILKKQEKKSKKQYTFGMKQEKTEIQQKPEQEQEYVTL